MRDPRPLVEALEAAGLQPLWDRYMTLLTREPAPIDAPMHWSWKGLQSLIERAVAEVSMADAERRVLLLSHPAFAPHPYTTTNLSAGVQILCPGEHADSHRHTVAALRFVMEGEGAVTWVDGKRCEMTEGDLILTPAWCWHEHRNEGSQRVVWFDGLDLPLAAHLRAMFLQFGRTDDVPPQIDDAVARAGALPTPLGRPFTTYSPKYRYEGTAIDTALSALPADADGSRRLRYVNPVTGGPVMPTLDCYAMGLQAGTSTRAYRSTGNAVVVVAKGSGRSRVGDKTIDWQKGDVFTLPHWNWVSHRAEAPEAQLFLMTDQPVLESMGYLRTEYES